MVAESKKGTIYLVGTPLGNLEDITLRALRILREADLIACEDTRHTRRLLEHFEIRKRLLSYHEHNEAQRATELAERALRGESIAVVSDAGMPGISDPGYRLVRAAIGAGINVVPVPGPVAIETALTASGLPTDSFRFQGFLPARKIQRRKALEAIADETATVVFYEAPHRVTAALRDVVEVLGDRPVVVARELTKVHEEFLRGAASEVLEQLRTTEPVKGEITLLIGRRTSEIAPAQPVAERVFELVSEGLSRMDAIKQTARENRLPKREVYRLVEEKTKTAPDVS